MRYVGSNFVLVSVMKDNKHDNLKLAKAEEILSREGIEYELVTVKWDDTFTKAFVLESTDIQEHHRNLEIAKNLALLFNKEQVLEVHNDGFEQLHYSEA